MGNSRKLTILNLSSMPIWSRGDKEGHPSVYNVLKGFAEAGHEVHYAWPRDYWQYSENKPMPEWEIGDFKHPDCLYMKYEGIHLHRFYTQNFIENSVKKSVNALKKGRGLINYIHFSSVVRGAIRFGLSMTEKICPDVIYGHCEEACCAAYWVGLRAGVPNVSRIYGSRLYPVLGNLKATFISYPRIVGHKIPCRYMIMTDDGTFGDQVLKKLNVPEERVRFWRNGVDDNYNSNLNGAALKAKHNILQEQPIILSSSRLEYWKRIDRLIHTAPKVIAECPDVVYLILGDGKDRLRLESIVANYGLQKNFRFVGQQPQQDVAAYMQCADIQCLLSDLTSANNPTLEAMMMGICVVVLDTGNVHQIIETGNNGIIIGINQLDTLADHLIELIKDPQKRYTMGKNARIFAKKEFYSWNKRVQMEVSLIETLCNTQKSSKG